MAAAAGDGIPESTYRLQLHAGFTFADATRIVGYLKALGITHVYASPILKARAGSTHGYDVVDHNQINPELGGEAGLREFSAALEQHGLGLILDTVPNHMGVGTNDNAWWNDVLEHGRQSRFAHYFDIAWDLSPRAQLHGKVLLPILGDHYGKALESGQIKLVHEDGRFFLAYYQRRLPVNPATVQAIASRVSGTGAELAEQVSANPDLLHELVSSQHFRLAYWRTAPDEINYRRFFDINDLAALQMERKDVFDAAHALTLKLVREGAVTGLRIDHPDGLYDPQAYFQRLCEAGVGYVLAEKILGPSEPLPRNWAIAGTSGYDALNVINGLFVDSRGECAFTRLYQRHTGFSETFEEIAYRGKLLILRISMASELSMLAYRLDGIALSHRDSQDFTLSLLTEALRQLIACFPVYRTYIASDGPIARDVEVIDEAIERAVRRAPEIERAVFEFIRSVLLLQWPADRHEMLHFAGRFQQLTAPVMAKGVEDTAFYRYGRLVSLNEVGGDPGTFGITPQHAHEYFATRQRLWPGAMNTLSTHDTKRSEDVRARLNALSELPDEWNCRVTQFMKLTRGSGVHAEDLYSLLQAMLGIWPTNGAVTADLDGRLKAYMRKSLREAKLRSSWTNPDEAYEAKVCALIDALLSSAEYKEQFGPFHERLARLGAINSLAQSVLKFTVPGVADTYQGTEIWDYSLVDPDNRRPVDYAALEELLQRCDRFHLSMLEHWPDGRIKLLVTTRLLHLRRSNPGLFTTGEYRPIRATGAKAEHVFAFMRSDGRRRAVVVVSRLVGTLLAERDWPLGEAAWTDTTLPLDDIASMADVFTDRPPESARLADILRDMPVAVLA